MSDVELIARLRTINKNYEMARGAHVDIRQAADRIEALSAKIKLMDDLDAINGEKIEALEAKLAAAVEAKAIWVNETKGGGLVTFTSKEAALRNVSPHDVRIAVKYVEAKDD